MIESDIDKISKEDAAEIDNLEREAKEFDKDAEIDRMSTTATSPSPQPHSTECLC